MSYIPNSFPVTMEDFPPRHSKSTHKLPFPRTYSLQSLLRHRKPSFNAHTPTNPKIHIPSLPLTASIFPKSPVHHKNSEPCHKNIDQPQNRFNRKTLMDQSPSNRRYSKGEYNPDNYSWRKSFSRHSPLIQENLLQQKKHSPRVNTEIHNEYYACQAESPLNLKKSKTRRSI